jgi:hypothetical protein
VTRARYYATSFTFPADEGDVRQWFVRDRNDGGHESYHDTRAAARDRAKELNVLAAVRGDVAEAYCQIEAANDSEAA